MWQDLYDQIATEYVIHRPPSTKIDAALNECEYSLGINLPASYRAFIHQFGPGELLGWFRMYAPLIDGESGASDALDIVNQHEMWQDPDGYWASTADPELVNRLVFCCDTGGGDAYFWDPNDVCDAQRNEYALYELPHSGINADVIRVADCFVDFINDFCLKTTWTKLVSEDRQTQDYWSCWRRA